LAALLSHLPPCWWRAGCIAVGGARAEATGPGQEAVSDVESPFAFHGQTTYIWQRKPSFGAGYSGENSLTPDRAKSYSFTATLDLGLRLWQGAEFHFNPEVAQGVPFSELHGVGGPSNGELAKTASTPKFYARGPSFVRRGGWEAARKSSRPISTSSPAPSTSNAWC
jgi:hypothetical protein